MTALETMGKNAKLAARVLATAGAKKDKALLAMADALEAGEAEILAANQEDLNAARAAGMSDSLLDRLALNHARIQGMAQGVRAVAAQSDPVGTVVGGSVRPNGLKIEQVRVPLGVIGIIYEARPNVTADAAALCLKAGNAVILRGGKEAFRSNQAVAQAMRSALEQVGLPKDCVQLVQDTSRSSAVEMMQLTEYLDVLIPRGGKGLIQSVVQNSRVPVIETGAGNCHVFVDESADLEMAAEIIFNAKTSRPPCATRLKPSLSTKRLRKGRCRLSKPGWTKSMWSCAAASGHAPFWGIRCSPPQKRTGQRSTWIMSLR